ncbi:MAG: hypothetical protein AAF724_08835 [Pseudomonadota bacterium]
MRFLLGLAVGAFALSSAATANADDTAKVMCEQFAISGATKTVMPTMQLSEDFIPKHHAPRNIPIEVSLPENVVAYIHFPIVEDGTYFIYATEPDRMAGLLEKNGDAISSSTVSAPEACPDVLTGGLTANINVGELTGPRPIAIELTAGAATSLRLIVSRDPIN